MHSGLACRGVAILARSLRAAARQHIAASGPLRKGRALDGLGRDASSAAPALSTIVQGIGFLAAGVIFAQGARVQGLTTAAGLWVTAAVGVLSGGGFFFLAIVATVVTAIVLSGLKIVEDRLINPTPRVETHASDDHSD